MKSNIWENMNMICESCVMNIESGSNPFPTSVVVKKGGDVEAVDVEVVQVIFGCGLHV